MVGWLVGRSVGRPVIWLITQEKATQHVKNKGNEQLYMIVEHVWDSTGVSVFCPVRKLKVCGHFILLIRSLLLLPLCACTCWRTSVILKITENDFHRNVIFQQDGVLPLLFIYTRFLVPRIISRWEKLVQFVDSFFTRPYTDKLFLLEYPDTITN